MTFDVDSYITQYASEGETFPVMFRDEVFTFRYAKDFADLLKIGKGAKQFATGAHHPAYAPYLPEQSPEGEMVLSAAFEMQELSAEPKLTTLDILKLSKRFPMDFGKTLAAFNGALQGSKRQAEEAKVDDLKNDSTATDSDTSS